MKLPVNVDRTACGAHIFALIAAMSFRALDGTIRARDAWKSSPRLRDLTHLRASGMTFPRWDRRSVNANGLADDALRISSIVPGADEASVALTRLGFTVRAGKALRRNGIGYRFREGALELMIWPGVDQAPWLHTRRASLDRRHRQRQFSRHGQRRPMAERVALHRWDGRQQTWRLSGRAGTEPTLGNGHHVRRVFVEARMRRHLSIVSQRGAAIITALLIVVVVAGIAASLIAQQSQSLTRSARQCARARCVAGRSVLDYARDSIRQSFKPGKV